MAKSVKNNCCTFYFFLSSLFVISFIPLRVFSQHLGGDGDGFAFNTLTQTACPALASTNVFYGGNADGFAVNLLTQSVCSAVPSTNVFYGGNADGFAVNLLTQAACSLPIELLSFTADCKNEKVILKWVTASEINNDFFTVEKTFDAINYSEVNKLKGAGNSNSTLYYSMTYENHYIGQSYYRLKQTDFDGNYKYSPIVDLLCYHNGSSNMVIYPNPNNGKFKIDSFEDRITKEVIIYNYLGEIIWESEISEKTFHLDLSNKAKGIYIIHINSQYKSAIKKLIIE